VTKLRRLKKHAHWAVVDPRRNVVVSVQNRIYANDPPDAGRYRGYDLVRVAAEVRPGWVRDGETFLPR
jgi:hypothetical protein